MHRQVREEREDRRHVGAVDRVGRLEQPQLLLRDAVGIAEERPARAEPGAERGRHGRRVDADRHDPRVGDLHLVLKRHQLAQERLLLGAPPAAVGLHDGRVAGDEVAERALVAGVVAEHEVGEDLAGRGRHGPIVPDAAIGVTRRERGVRGAQR
jgi:hypothetical protein